MIVVESVVEPATEFLQCLKKVSEGEGVFYQEIYDIIIILNGLLVDTHNVNSIFCSFNQALALCYHFLFAVQFRPPYNSLQFRLQLIAINPIVVLDFSFSDSMFWLYMKFDYRKFVSLLVENVYISNQFIVSLQLIT